MQRVTLDTNIFPANDLIEKAQGRAFEFARISVSDRELDAAPPHVHVEGTHPVAETAVLDESRFDDAVLASVSSPLDEILSILSSGGFPSQRSSLSDGERRLLRDAMILEAHLREKRDILVSDDFRAFVRHGKREALEGKFHTRILTRAEFLALLG